MRIPSTPDSRPDEQWKEVKDYDGRYLVSNQHRVWSVERQGMNIQRDNNPLFHDNIKRTVCGHEMNQFSNYTKGPNRHRKYVHLVAAGGGKRKRHYVDDLVNQAFPTKM